MKQGFTLIELLVVMVIMGILASIGLGSFQSAQTKARDAKRKAELNQITKALEVYYNDKGHYPLGAGTIQGCVNGAVCVGGASWQDENGTIYMVELPQDPKAPSYAYNYISADGKSYQLYARLENNRDVSVPKDASNNPKIFSDIDCGVSKCNYGVASSNVTASAGHTLVTE